MNRLVCFFFLFPICLGANFDLAESSFEKKIYGFAVINYLKVINEETDERKKEKSFFRLVESYYLLKQYGRSIEMIRQYFTHYPQGSWNLKIRYYEALNLIALNRLAQAENILLRYIDEYRDHDEVTRLYLILSELYQRQGKSGQAINLLSEVDSEHQFDLNYFLANIYEQEGQYQQAWEVIESVQMNRLSLVDPEEFLEFKLDLSIKLRKYNLADQMIKQSLYQIKEKERQEKFFFYQSHLFFLKEDYVQALIGYRNYIQKYPDSVWVNEAYFYLALTYEKTKQSILALEKLQQLAQLKNYGERTKEFKTRVDKLNYLIYRDMGHEEKKNIYLDRLLANSLEENFALKEKLIDLSKSQATNLTPWLSRYQALKIDSTDKIALLKKLLFTYYGHQEIGIAASLMDEIYRLSQDPVDLFILGDMYLSLKDYPQAGKIFLRAEKKFNQLQKGNDYLWDVLGFVHFKLDQLSRSKKYFEKNLAASDLEYQKNAQFYLAEIAQKEKNYPLAYKRYQAFLNDYPEDQKVKEVLFYLGYLSYHHLKDRDQALNFLNQAKDLLASEEEKNKILLSIAQIQLEGGDHQMALETLERVGKTRENPSTYYESLLKKAKIYFNLGELKKANAQYYEIINLEEESSESVRREIIDQAYYELFLIKLKNRAAREAYYYLSKIKENSPQSPLILSGYLALGDYYFSQKKYKSSINLYEEFIRFSTEKELKNYASFYQAVSYQRLKKDQDAYRTFLTIVETAQKNNYLDEYYFDSLFELGRYEYADGNYLSAKERFQKIIDQASSDSLKLKARKNLEIIETVKNPNPFKGLEKPPQIIRTISQLKSKKLKEKGYLLLMEIYYQNKKYDQVLKWSRRITSKSVHYEASVLWAVRSYWKMRKYKQLYEYGLEKYLDESFRPAKVDLEYFYYVLAFSSKKINYDQDGAIFLSELKRSFPNSDYLKKLE